MNSFVVFSLYSIFYQIGTKSSTCFACCLRVVSNDLQSNESPESKSSFRESA